MATINVPKIPDLHQRITFFTHTPHRPGDAVSIVYRGMRIGMARITEDHSRNSRYQVDIHGHGPTNTGHGYYTATVERIF